MNCYDFDAVVYEHDVWCIECLPAGINENSNGVVPIFADSEWDYIPTCYVCGGVHDYIMLLEV